MIYLVNAPILPHRCYGMYEYVPAKVYLLRKEDSPRSMGWSLLM